MDESAWFPFRWPLPHALSCAGSLAWHTAGMRGLTHVVQPNTAGMFVHRILPFRCSTRTACTVPEASTEPARMASFTVSSGHRLLGCCIGTAVTRTRRAVCSHFVLGSYLVLLKRTRPPPTTLLQNLYGRDNTLSELSHGANQDA